MSNSTVSVLVVAFYLLFLYVCSDLPYAAGVASTDWIVELGKYSAGLGAAFAATLMAFFVLDLKDVKNKCFAYFYRGTMIALFGASLLAASKTYSSARLIVFLSLVVLAPVLAIKVKNAGWNQPTPAPYISVFATSALCVGVSSILAWIIWVATWGGKDALCMPDRSWSVAYREQMFLDVGCNFEIELSIRTNETVLTTSIPCFSENSKCQATDEESFLPAAMVNANFTFKQSENSQSQLEISTTCQSALRPTMEAVLDAYSFHAFGTAHALDQSMTSFDVIEFTNRFTNTSGACRVRYRGCLRAFLVWMSPLIGGVFSCWLGFAIMVLRPSQGVAPDNSTLLEAKTSAETSAGFQSSPGVPITRSAVKSLVRIFLVFFFSVYTGSMVGGASMHLSNAILSFAFLAGISTLVIFESLFGAGALYALIKSNSFERRIQGLSSNHWVKAFLVIFGSPLILLFLVLDALRNLRLAIRSRVTREQDDQIGFVFSSRTHQLFSKLRILPWTSILSKIILLMIFYMVVQVGIAKFTSVFMSWVNTEIEASGMDWQAVTAIFFGIGTVIFLNPFIPGVPVYILGGVMLVRACTSKMGYWYAVLYTIFISFLVKIVAIVLQQKVIGEMFGSRPSIKALIAVNSPTVKAIKLILMERGLTTPKVMILCGGPDWPTSVTTGILRCSVWQMLLGSTPVVVLIAPCVLSGAFLLRARENEIWASMSTLVTACAFLLQTGSMCGAGYYISKTLRDRAAQVEAIEDDQEVVEYKKRSIEKELRHADMQDWHRSDFPLISKALLVSGTICSLFAFHIANAASESCFLNFEVTDSIEKDLNSNVFNIIVYPMGYVVALLVFVSIACYILANAVTSLLFTGSARVSPVAGQNTSDETFSVSSRSALGISPEDDLHIEAS